MAEMKARKRDRMQSWEAKRERIDGSTVEYNPNGPSRYRPVERAVRPQAYREHATVNQPGQKRTGWNG